MKNHKRSKSRHTSHSRLISRRVIFAFVFALIGIAALIAARASSPVAYFEPEHAILSGNVTTANDATASGGQYVQFNPGSTTSPAHKPLAPGTAWQWQLTGTVNEAVLDGVSGPKMYDIDMFSATPALIARLKAKGIYVVCYVESGDWAQGRPDAGDYAAAILGRAIGGFPDEKFINVNALDSPAGPTGKTLRQIMAARFDLAKSKGCDGIEPDLDDLHTYNTGFSINMDQMVAYNKAIIDMGHARGMSVGLKNGASGGTFEQKMLQAGADWALNEECNQFDECDGYRHFVAAGKAVFQVEYLDNQSTPYGGASGTCTRNNTANFDGIVKDSSSSLSALPRIACR